MVWADGGNVQYKNFTDNTSITGIKSSRLDGNGTEDDLGAVGIPAIACKGSSVFAAWTTGIGVFYMNSTNEGATWTSNTTIILNSTPITFVQKAQGESTDTTLDLTLTNVVAGNLLVVAGSINSQSRTLSVSDDRGNTWTGIASNPQLTAGTSGHGYIWYAENVFGGTTVITITKSSTGATLEGAAHEYSGIAPSGALDVQAGAGGASASPDSGSVVTTRADELIFASSYTPANAKTYSADTSFTLRVQQPTAPSSGKLGTEDQIVSAIGTYSGGPEISSSTNWGAQIATFKAPAATAPRWNRIYGTDTIGADFSVAYGTNDNVWIAFVHDIGASEIVNVTNSSRYGGTDPVVTRQNMSSDINAGSAVSIYVNSSVFPEKIFVASKNDILDDLEFNRSLDGGATWSGSSVIVGSFAISLDIIQFNSSLLVVAGQDVNANDILISNSTNNGTSWNPSFRADTIGAGTSKAQEPSLATDYSNLYIFWQQNDTTSVPGSNWNVYYRKWNETSGWDGVRLWQNLSSTGSSLTPFPNARIDNSSANYIEVIFANRSGTAGGIDIIYDFINLTSVAAGAAADTTLPQFSSNSTNSTTADTFVNFTITVTDDTGLSGYVFESNNSGRFLNSSFVSFSGTSATAWNVTRLNATGGAQVQWRFYANDTSNNRNVSETYNLTTIDGTRPTWSNNRTNSTLAGTFVNHSALLSDETGLDYYIFEFWNGTNTGTNISTVDISGTAATANQSVVTNSTVGTAVRWRYYFNDTANNWNATFLFNYTTANLSIAVEAGGPYTGATATVVIAGNITDGSGNAIANATVTVDIFKANNLTNRLGRVVTNSSGDGKYFATFNNLDIAAYRVNVTAEYLTLSANAIDVFDIVSIVDNCQTKTITLRGKVLDTTTGLKIPSGTASLTVQETGDKTDTSVVDGAWSVEMTTCVVSGNTYTLTVKLTDNLLKFSLSELKFVAP
mgnify:CR=1 FL=1